MKEARRVFLLGDDHLALGGLARLLEDSDGWVVAPNLEDGPDAVLVDFGGGEESENVRSLAPRYPVLAIASEPARAREALASGARGVVSRRTSGARLSRALDAILEGLVVIDEDLAEGALRPPQRPLGSHETLTPRELEVLELLASGLSNKEIADRLGVSFHTVKFHVNAILGKLGASSRTEVVALAARAGLLRF
jgi:DNA-binding NarL/FixJ family response regulator